MSGVLALLASLGWGAAGLMGVAFRVRDPRPGLSPGGSPMVIAIGLRHPVVTVLLAAG